MILFLKIWFTFVTGMTIWSSFKAYKNYNKKEAVLLEKLVDETKNSETGITVIVTALIYVILIVFTTLVYVPEMLLIATGVLSIRLLILTIANIILGFVTMFIYSFTGTNSGIGFKIKVVDLIWSLVFYPVILFTLFTI